MLKKLDGRSVTRFAFRIARSIASCSAIQTARDGRLGKRLIDDDKLNFAPRVGWAWTPGDRWSVRAGVGCRAWVG